MCTVVCHLAQDPGSSPPAGNISCQGWKLSDLLGIALRQGSSWPFSLFGGNLYPMTNRQGSTVAKILALFWGNPRACYKVGQSLCYSDITIQVLPLPTPDLPLLEVFQRPFPSNAPCTNPHLRITFQETWPKTVVIVYYHTYQIYPFFFSTTLRCLDVGTEKVRHFSR